MTKWAESIRKVENKRITACIKENKCPDCARNYPNNPPILVFGPFSKTGYCPECYKVFWRKV